MDRYKFQRFKYKRRGNNMSVAMVATFAIGFQSYIKF